MSHRSSLAHVLRDWWQALTGGQAPEDVHRAAHAPRYRPGVVETPAATEQQLNAWLPPYLEGMCSAKLEDRATRLRLSCNLTPGHRGPHHDPDGSMWDGPDADPWAGAWAHRSTPEKCPRCGRPAGCEWHPVSGECGT